MPQFSFEGLEPNVHPDAFVAPSATLVGDVVVEKGASVTFRLRRGDQEFFATLKINNGE